MNPFLDKLHFDNYGMVNGRRNIILTARFRAVTSLGIIEAPCGMVSDGGSIPRIAWSIIGGPFDEYLEECVIHDLLYSPFNKEYSRSEADFILKELMWNRDVNKVKIMAFYTAVRTFGWRNFKAQPYSLI
jgi:hypothetical protein